jgi:thiol-disulfide isomerase/thioredoxin
MIETGRKTQALGYYRESLTRAPKEFMVKASQDDVVRRLQRREKHYKLLGEAAPELPDIAEWFGRPVKLAELRGKVIVLDFWATWCGPCISAFPSINEWNKKYSGDGLVILGVTGFTGSVEGDQATETEELGFLRRFKKEYELEYDFVIGRNFDNQKIYGADSIPTTIIIDRKGIVRYAEAGAGREPEIEREIVRLLAEK